MTGRFATVSGVSTDATLRHTVDGLPLTGLRVEVVKGPDRGRSCIAKADSITIGTAPGNDLVLGDETVSRYHAELLRQRDRIIVKDHGSTNGVRLGTCILEHASVAPGTVLDLGRTQVRVDDGAPIEVELYGSDHFGALRGRTPEMRGIMARLERAARTDVSVLLLGETGTGKEVMARMIHEASPRSGHPFEVVDCGALMPTLIASELFGHEKGAFTGADRRHIGAFERADGGTLFLDEIGELPPPLQAGLLGALERRTFRRVGGHEPISVNVRVVSATNRELRGEVNAGRFRPDLYFRIAVVLVKIPALRERTNDIPILVEHFLREVGHDGPATDVIPTTVMQSLEDHHWPGNVRELRNFVEAALAMGEAPKLEAAATATTAKGGVFPAETAQRLLQMTYKDARGMLLHEFESLYLTHLMKKAGHNVSKAAREAKMNRSYLIDMLKRHDIR